MSRTTKESIAKETSSTTSPSPNNDEQSSSNRLAPYNPTHTTAQTNALSLLKLTSNDVFFDLGCGDGRLILSALEYYYNDDYLLKVHQERFNKLQLGNSRSIDEDDINTTPQHQYAKKQQQSANNDKSPKRRDIYRNTNNESTPTTATQSTTASHHVRSPSDYSVPHLMRTASQESDSCSSGFVSSVKSPPRHNSNIQQGNVNSDWEDNKKTEEDDTSTTRSAHNINRIEVTTNGSIDVLSVLSPDSPMKRMYTPSSPITPIANNKMKVNGISLNSGDKKHLPPFPSKDNTIGGTDNNIPTQRLGKELFKLSTPNEDLNDKIPTTIETPSPENSINQRGHHTQISELPTGISFDHDDAAGIIEPSSSKEGIPPTVSRDESKGSQFDILHNLSGGLLMTIPSNDPIDNTSPNSGTIDVLDDIGEVTKKNCTLYTTNAPQANEIYNKNNSGYNQGKDKHNSSSTEYGLQCVGIEYNQALAESAQSNIKESYIYPHIYNKVCIRWGDVLDEWNRDNNNDVSKGEGGIGCEVQLKEKKGGNNENQLSWHESSESDKDGDASKLTLLNDATAVFVYLLPQGLKKVKPLLYEAAVRRKRQQDEQLQVQQQQQQKLTKNVHPLQQTSFDKQSSSGTISQEFNSSSNNDGNYPPKQLVHRKGYSHVSDITDYDFRMNSKTPDFSTRDVSGGGENEESSKTRLVPNFRVVSYMFSIPGWKPSKIDRSSKGNCPLYLYENIHDEK